MNAIESKTLPWFNDMAQRGENGVEFACIWLEKVRKLIVFYFFVYFYIVFCLILCFVQCLMVIAG